MSIRWLVPIASASARRLVSPTPYAAKWSIARSSNASRPVATSLTRRPSRALGRDLERLGLEVDVPTHLAAQCQRHHAAQPAGLLEHERQPRPAVGIGGDGVAADDVDAGLTAGPGERGAPAEPPYLPLTRGQPLLLDVGAAADPQVTVVEATDRFVRRDPLRPALDVAQHVPDPRRLGGHGDALLVLHDVPPRVVPNGTTGWSTPHLECDVARIKAGFPGWNKGFLRFRSPRSRDSTRSALTVEDEIATSTSGPRVRRVLPPRAAVHRTDDRSESSWGRSGGPTFGVHGPLGVKPPTSGRAPSSPEPDSSPHRRGKETVCPT